MGEISLREYCEQIQRTIERGHYAEAVAHGKHVLKQYPKHIATYQLLGKAMLEAGQDEYAADMFRRVLSADPENMIAWVGLSEVYNNRDKLDAAVWYLERAFEVTADSKAIGEELRQLYGRRDGVEPQRTSLTPAALARLYLKGDLLSRAISELRTLLAEHPERVDLSVALAEALWRNEQRLEASEVCQEILDELPYCLKANLILGAIWTSGGREEGQVYLRRAEALDPENRMAQEFFGTASPLPARQVQIAPLEYKPPTEEERPAWMAEEGVPLTTEEAALVDITAGLEAQIEIPSWLEEIAMGEEAEMPAPPSSAEPLEGQPPEEAIPVPAEEIPAWLTSAGEEELAEGKPEAMAEEEAPEWLGGLGLELAGEEEETPEWLAELDIEPTVEAEAPAVPREEVEEEIPEWLAELGVEAASEEIAPATSLAEQPPDWLVGLREQLTEEVEEAPAPEEVAPAVEEIPPTEAPEEVKALAPAAEEAPLPAWLEGEEMPSGDEALAWLEQLAQGKEEELRAQIEAETEERMAEIMGRPKAVERPPEEAAPELAPPTVEAVPEEAVAPSAEEAFGWTAFGEPEAPLEAIMAAEEAVPIEEAAPPEAPEWARMEEAFGWTAFGEPEAPPEAIPAEEAPPEAPEWARMMEEVEAPPVIELPTVEPEIPTAEVPVEPFAAERAYLKEHPRDYEAWLALARTLWQADECKEALEAYSRVIRSGKLLESVIPDLEGYLERRFDVRTQRALGDAYMKDGQLQKALNTYRQALEAL
ncbi:MAG: tetratricopeptide repeat protein [Anaerolineae bacterium]